MNIPLAKRLIRALAYALGVGPEVDAKIVEFEKMTPEQRNAEIQRHANAVRETYRAIESSPGVYVWLVFASDGVVYRVSSPHIGNALVIFQRAKPGLVANRIEIAREK